MGRTTRSKPKSESSFPKKAELLKVYQRQQAVIGAFQEVRNASERYIDALKCAAFTANPLVKKAARDAALDLAQEYEKRCEKLREIVAGERRR